MCRALLTRIPHKAHRRPAFQAWRIQISLDRRGPLVSLVQVAAPVVFLAKRIPTVQSQQVICSIPRLILPQHREQAHLAKQAQLVETLCLGQPQGQLRRPHLAVAVAAHYLGEGTRKVGDCLDRQGHRTTTHQLQRLQVPSPSFQRRISRRRH